MAYYYLLIDLCEYYKAHIIVNIHLSANIWGRQML